MPVRASEFVALKVDHAIGAPTCLVLKFRPEAVHYSIDSERRFIERGSDFVTALELSEEVALLKALPQVAFSRT